MSLIGTKGCINYNPVLAQRQFRYSMREAPTFVVLETYLFPYDDGSATEILHWVRKAWENVIHMERDSRSWALDKEVIYG